MQDQNFKIKSNNLYLTDKLITRIGQDPVIRAAFSDSPTEIIFESYSGYFFIKNQNKYLGVLNKSGNNTPTTLTFYNEPDSAPGGDETYTQFIVESITPQGGAKIKNIATGRYMSIDNGMAVLNFTPSGKVDITNNDKNVRSMEEFDSFFYSQKVPPSATLAPVPTYENSKQQVSNVNIQKRVSSYTFKKIDLKMAIGIGLGIGIPLIILIYFLLKRFKKI
jgi:hypothetical protein